MKHRALLVVLIISTLFVGGWLARNQLAEVAITTLLSNDLISDITLNVNDLGPGKSQISYIRFSLVTASGQVQVEAKDININYSLSQLVHGRVTSLLINTLLVHQVVEQNSQQILPVNNSIFNFQQLKMALNYALGDLTLFERATLNRVIINSDSAKELKDMLLRLEIINTGDTHYAELSLQNIAATKNNELLRQFIIRRLVVDEYQIELKFADKNLVIPAKNIPAKIDFSVNAKNIKVDYIINPAELKNWLLPVVKVPHKTEIAKVTGAMDIQQDVSGNIFSSITATTSKVLISSYHAQKVVVKMIMNYPLAENNNQLILLPGSFFGFDNINSGKFFIAENKINISGDLLSSATGYNFTGNIGTDLIALTYNSQLIKFKGIGIRLVVDAEKLQMDGGFSPFTLPGKFNFTLGTDFVTGNGKLSVTPAELINLTAGKYKLSQLLKPWTYPFDLLAGSIYPEFHADWSNKRGFRLISNIKVKDAGGILAQDIVFSGLSFDHELELLPQLHSLHTSGVSLKHLDSGISASNMLSNLTLQSADNGPQPQYLVQGLQGEIFDGSFSAEDFVYDINRKLNKIKINLKNIDLAKVVETQQLDGMEVTGRLDGSLPVEINEQVISIENGSFINDVHMGTIRYNPGASTDQLRQNKLTGLALDALKNFSYSYLSAGVRFAPDGLLSINLQLKGTSPELDAKRPVHLNINTEQNLVSLLKSLRFAQGLSDNIDKQVRKKYEQSINTN